MFLQFSKTRICAYKFGEYCKRKLWTDNNDFWKNTNTKKVKLVESIWCKTFVDDCAKYFCLDSIIFVIHNQTPIRTWASFKCGAKCLQFGRKFYNLVENFTIWSKICQCEILLFWCSVRNKCLSPVCGPPKLFHGLDVHFE